MKSGIYYITSPSGRRYIGSSVHCNRRFSGHKTALRRGTHHCDGLQAACNKYGLENLTFTIVERCAPEQLIEREQSHLDRTAKRDMYNTRRIADTCGPMDEAIKANCARRGKPDHRQPQSHWLDVQQLCQLHATLVGSAAFPLFAERSGAHTTALNT